MSNIKNQMSFFNVITGEIAKPEEYGVDGRIYRKSDNVDMIFDSRGSYLGVRSCRGKFVDDKHGNKVYTCKKGIYDFKSFLDIKKYQLQSCDIDFIETGEGTYAHIGEQKIE